MLPGIARPLEHRRLAIIILVERRDHRLDGGDLGCKSIAGDERAIDLDTFAVGVQVWRGP